MQLTKEEQAMLDGELGPATQKAMHILTAIGDIYGAQRMARISRVHVASGTPVSTGVGGVKFIEWMADNGGRARVFATVNPSAIDDRYWRELGVPQEYHDLQMRLTGAYERLNIVTAYSCTPYLIGNVPAKGELLSSAESSAICMYNGFFGARTNRQGNPSTLSSAITGRVPVYGLLLEENRFGSFVVKVEARCETAHDFATLGYYTGAVSGNRVPVLAGDFAAHATVDNCKMMAAGMNSSAAVAHFHIAGLTPEAPSVAAALGGKAPEETFVFDEAARRETEAKLCSASGERLDMVVLGCPHVSLLQVQEIVSLLGGRRIAPGVVFQILTSDAIKAVCDRQGYTESLEGAGAMLLSRTCPTCYPLGEAISGARDIRSLATDSSKMAHYIAADSGRMPVYYGSTEECVEAAVRGNWR